MFRISRFDFNNDAPKAIAGSHAFQTEGMGINWPVVYVINNDMEAYVGETLSASRRIEQHLQNEDRRRLTEIRLITDETFNKSVILDLESFLIRYMSADGRFSLQNGNNGLRNHEYYERSTYEKEFRIIWRELKKHGLVNRTTEEIENSEMFKYSPYKVLGDEQLAVQEQIIKAFSEAGTEDRQFTVIVNGGAGTGKTILAVYLMKFFSDLNTFRDEYDNDEDISEEDELFLLALKKIRNIKKIGIVLPQKSLRLSVGDVFESVQGLSKDMVLSPSDVADDYAKTKVPFDLLIVDEAHRLKYRERGHLSDYKTYSRCNLELGLDEYDNDEDISEEDELFLLALKKIRNIKKIGIVLPQKSLRLSVGDVFESVQGLSKDMVLSPSDVADDYAKTKVPFDLLIVDEAHRLKYRERGHLSDYKTYSRCNLELGLDEINGNELDWIMGCSRNRILFRDELQLVRPCDIDRDRFIQTTEDKSDIVFRVPLSTQFRCIGGNGYIDFVKAIFSDELPEPYQSDDYDLRLYTDCNMMINDIKKLDDEYGLCRTVAGFAWKWNKKGPSILIQDKAYWWNRTNEKWITSKYAHEEIGCIHTVQGYDLNYAGVIIGEDLKYDPVKNKLYADKKSYHDQQGKSGVANDPEALKELVINIYLTLLTRGIRGTFVYICNDELREHLKGCFSRVVEPIH